MSHALALLIRDISIQIDKLGHLEASRPYKELNRFERIITILLILFGGPLAVLYFLSYEMFAGFFLLPFLFVCSLFVIYKFFYLLFFSNTKHYEKIYEVSFKRRIFIEIANALWLGVFTFFLGIVYFFLMVAYSAIMQTESYKELAINQLISENKLTILISLVVYRFVYGLLWGLTRKNNVAS